MHTSASKTAQAPNGVSDAFERHAEAHAAFSAVAHALQADPDLLAAVDEAAGRMDLDGLPRAAAAVMAPLAVARAALSRIHPRPDDWDFASVGPVAHRVSAILSGIPGRNALAEASEASREALEQRGVVLALEGEIDRLAGPDGPGRDDRVARAASAVRALRSVHGMPGLPDADAALARLIDERSSMSRLADGWRDLAHAVCCPPADFDPAAARPVVEQIVALGIEGLLQAQSLPASALGVIEAFEAERDDVLVGLARFAHLDDAWVREPAGRLRRAAGIVSERAGDVETVNLYLSEVGLGGLSPDEVTTLASLRERIDAVEADVASARMVGPAFEGMATDVSDLRDRLARWAWLSAPGEGGPSGDALRRVLGGPGVLAKARLLETASRVVGATIAHEREFGQGWEGKPSEQARIEALTSLVADIDALRSFDGPSARSTAYVTVSRAAAVTARLGSERAVMEDLSRSGAGVAMAAMVGRTLAEALACLAEAGHGPSDTDDPWELAGAAAALHSASCEASEAMALVSIAAGFGMMDGACALGAAAARLSLAGACAARARDVLELAAARSALQELGLGPTIDTFERAGTPPSEWGRKCKGLIALPGTRPDGEVRHVPVDAGGARPRLLFAVPSASPSTAWEEEAFPAYATRGTGLPADR